jgi:predicted HicB family RNase H-like nuclease
MNQTLQHKGYSGSVLYSAEDEMLHGRVLGIRDTISYGGTTVKSLRKNFRDAVDEYLRFCEQTGKVPNPPFKGSFNVRVSAELHQRAALYADQNDMKLNTVVQKALNEYLTRADRIAA